MAERRTYRHPQYKPKPFPFNDLREFLDYKRQHKELDESGEGLHRRGNGPPPDPPSPLRDTLRGDRSATSQQRRYDPQRGQYSRGRGSFRRQRGGPRYTPGDSEHRPQEKYNIKVELSTETGQRKYTLDDQDLLNRHSGQNKTNQAQDFSQDNNNQNRRGSYQGRGNYRGGNRGQGNRRGVYYYRGQNRGRYPKNQERYDNKSKTEYQSKSQLPANEGTVPVDEEEYWHLDDAHANTATTTSTESGEPNNKKEEDPTTNEEDTHSDEVHYTNEETTDLLREYIEEEEREDTAESKEVYYDDEYYDNDDYHDENENVDENNDKVAENTGEKDEKDANKEESSGGNENGDNKRVSANIEDADKKECPKVEVEVPKESTETDAHRKDDKIQDTPASSSQKENIPTSTSNGSDNVRNTTQNLKQGTGTSDNKITAEDNSSAIKS